MWEIEEIQRAGSFIILVVKFDGDTRGSITCHSPEEVEKWQQALTTLNSQPESET
jgi:hypothetical protein